MNEAVDYRVCHIAYAGLERKQVFRKSSMFYFILQEINQIVANIRVVTDSAVASMAQVGQRTSQGEQHLSDTASSLNEILHASAEVDQMMRSIASTNTQQSAAARELSERMLNISHRIEASTQEIAQAGGLIRDLSLKAEEMGTLVRHFDTEHCAA